MRSTSLHIHCLRPGLLTSVQDAGRPGHAAQGVPTSGALDRVTYHRLNQLVGNAPDTPVLELTLHGPELLLRGEGCLAMAGADMGALLGDHPLHPYTTYFVRGAAHLRFGRASSGCRTYLAVGGQWEVPRWLGSASVLTGLPPVAGLPQALRAGDVIDIRTHAVPYQRLDNLPTEPSSPPVLRVLPGPEWQDLPRSTIARFFGESYRVSPRSNRMGCRLSGPGLPLGQLREIISSPVRVGTVQLPPNGQPILLLADAQTTGGYCRMAQLVDEDISRLAQLCPGQAVRFRLAD